MKKILLSALLAAAFAVGSVNAQLITNNYAGNGNTSFGGAVGNGSLQIVNDNLGALNFTYTRGTSDFNNALVIYFDTVSGGATSTSGFTDNADGLRRAISGVNTNTAERSTLNFAGGFAADYAIAFNNSFAGLWSLSNPASFPFQTSANLLPLDASQTETSYTFSINVTDIGLTVGSGQTFTFFASYTSETAFRSVETIGASYTGSPSAGWNTFDAAGSNSFTTVPEPSTYALLTLSALALGGYAVRRRARK
jgi:hypothetical protein